MNDKPTWGDVLRKRDPNFDARRTEAKHQELLDTQGCVIRALNSILGVSLTRAQEELRFGLAERNATDLLIVLIEKRSRGEAITDIDTELSIIMNAERERVLRYIRQLASQTTTPAGRELQKYDIRHAQLQLTEMLELLQSGQKLMLLTPHHAAHISQDLKLDGFISLSDDGMEVRGLDPNGEYDAFVFKPRN